MDYLLKDEKAIPLLLKYLFYKIEVEMLTGVPTLIIVDEAGILLKNQTLAKEFDNWLVTFRKLNAGLLFAMQNLNQIKDNPIFPSMLGNCRTKIFLPDPNAMSEDIYELYRKVGLNSVEIRALSEAQIKKEYIIKNDFGTNKFEFTLSPLELALIGATGINEQTEMKKILEQTDDVKQVNLRWVEEKFGNFSKEYNFIKEIIGGE